MANSPPRNISTFPGILLISVGILLLLHNYRGFSIAYAIGHWWPLILIVWGGVKLYERTAATRAGSRSAAPVTAGEILLVLGLLSLLGVVAAVDIFKDKGPWVSTNWGDKFDFDLDVAPKNVPADARITVRNTRGNISARSSDEAQIRVDGKRIAKAWNESEAQRVSSGASVEIVPSGDGFEIRPSGNSAADSRVSLDLEIAVPKKASVTIRNEKGDTTVSDMFRPVSVTTTVGDVEVRGTTGDVSIDTHKGDVKVSDTKGNVKISGRGGEVNVSNATGGLTLDGEFYGPIRADKIAKGVRFISSHTDLTISQLAGHMEAGPGNLEIVDAPGNLTVRAQDDINIENATGKVKVDNRNGNVEVRFPSPPKEDVEINNSSAGITLSLPSSASFEIQADCHSCDIDSEFSADSLKRISNSSGDSHMEGKYGSGRGPKITLKTSYGPISLHMTSSDVPAPLSPARPKTPPTPPEPEEN